MNELIYGSLKPLANVGEAGIKTSGAYHHASGEKVNHAEQFNKEHAHKALYGKNGRSMNSKVPCIKADVAKIKRLMNKQGLKHRELMAKAELSNTAFDNAMMGKSVWVTTVEKIANALGLTGEEVTK